MGADVRRDQQDDQEAFAAGLIEKYTLETNKRKYISSSRIRQLFDEREVHQRWE